MKRTGLVLLAAALVATAASPSAAAETNLVVLGTSVTGPALADLVPAYERAHPGVHIDATTGGAVNIASQITSGAGADLVVAGTSVTGVVRTKLAAPVAIFSFHEALIVPKGSTKVRSLRDLANPGVRVVFGTPGSPQAAFAHTLLAKASEKYGADFERKVMGNVVTTKPSEAQVAAAVKSGTADAAVGFTADASDALDALPVPADGDTVTTVSVSLVSSTSHAAAAQAFADYLKSADAQAIYRKHHLDPPR